MSRKRILEAIAVEQEALAAILKALLAKLRKTADMLPCLPHDIPFQDRIRLIESLEKTIACEIQAVSEKERALHELLKILLGAPGRRC